MMLLSYKMSNGCDNEKRRLWWLCRKSKNTNHLLNIDYISGICINMAHPIFGVINTGVYQQTARPEGATLHSPGHHPGYKAFTDNAPCKGSSNVPMFLQLPLQGALIVCIRLPRALPWAMEDFGLSAHFVLLLPNPPIESRSYIKINSSITNDSF